MLKLAFQPPPLPPQRSRSLQVRDYAALGGAAVLGDTAHQLHHLEDTSNQMSELHQDLAGRNFADMKDPDAFYTLLKRYGILARKSMHTRVMGVPFSSVGPSYPLSMMFGAPPLPRATPLTLLKHHTGISNMDPKLEGAFHDSYGHYEGYAEHPSSTQLREALTGKALGGVHEMTQGFRDAGMTPEHIGVMLKSSDPMLALTEHVKASPHKDKLIKEMYKNLGRFFTNNQPAEKYFAGESPDMATVFKGGPSAYGKSLGELAHGAKIPLAVGSLGLLGYEGFRQAYGHKQASTHETARHRADEALAAGELAGGGLLLNKSRQYRPSNLILATAGHLSKPIAPNDTGAGHMQPARAFAELMRQHPAVRAGDFQVGEAYRTMNKPETTAWEQSHGFLDPVQSEKYFPASTIVHGLRGNTQNPFSVIGTKGRPHAGVMFDSGMGGGLPTFFGVVNQPKFSWNPKGAVGFISDYAYHGSDIDQKANMLNPNPKWDGRMPAITFGRQVDGKAYGRMKPWFHSSTHPLVSQKVIDNAKAWTEDKRGSVWTNLAQQLQHEDPQSAAQLASAVGAGKKIFTVSGSSRGDLVAYRAASLQQALRQHGLADKVQVIAALGNAKGHNLDKSAALLDDFPEVVRVGHTNRYPGVDMNDMVHASDGHWNTTGASSFAESLLSPTHTFYTTHYKDTDPAGVGVYTRQIAEMKRRGLDTHYWDTSIYEPDKWNAGAINLIRNQMHGRGRGADEANTPEELLPFLRQIASGVTPRYAARAAKQVADTEVARKDLANAIISKAMFLRSSAENSKNWRVAGGAALLGAGGLAAAQAYQNRPAEPTRLQQATQTLSNLLHHHRR